MKARTLAAFTAILLGTIPGRLCLGDSRVLWQIGEADQSSAGMALAPDEYRRFLEFDFGWEDRFFLVGHSNPARDWPYVLPGPADTWGGTWGTSGIRSHVLTILFGLEDASVEEPCVLVVDVLDCHESNPPLLKVIVNDTPRTFQLKPGSGKGVETSDIDPKWHQRIEVPIPASLLRSGGNEIRLTTLSGSWLCFDAVALRGPENLEIEQPREVFVRDVAAADYEIVVSEGRAQPLLVDVEHIDGEPCLSVLLDGKEIFMEAVEAGRYQFEVPMPAVKEPTQSRYEVRVGSRALAQGTVQRRSCQPITPAGYVDTLIGTAHSRWMIAPGPWMPFSLVKLSPDNQNAGWQAGYDPTFESVGVFSHIHEWTLGGLGMLPVHGPLQILVGDQARPDEGYRSRIDKTREQGPLGTYSVWLSDYDIQAELTATTRCGFQRYTYPKGVTPRVMIDLQIPAEYTYELEGVQIRQVDAHRVEGFSKQLTPNTWSGGVSQAYTLHFVMEFDQPIAGFGVWSDGSVERESSLETGRVGDAGAFVEFATDGERVIQVRSGLSLVSLENARLNLRQEVTEPFGWDSEAVRRNQVEVWNELLNRVRITTTDRREKVRFYSNMYRALCSRNTFSDVNGEWVDATENVQRFDNPDSVALGCDAFWNTFWNLNQFWNLVTPEWSSRWVRSQLAMYEANGWLAKGPAGMEYVPVMVAEHEIPLIVGAYQMGIRDYDAEQAFAAVTKMQTTLPEKVGDGLAGNRDLAAYLKHHYVPYDKGRFSNSLEYAFDDWTVAQFAKALGKNDEYREFSERGGWWRNVIDPDTGYARMKHSDGSWLAEFDPFHSGRNEHYVEGNAWQLTFYVPQDIPGLANVIGWERALERLTWGFGESYKWRFNAPNDQYWDYPIMQGNQQAMHFAFLFNWLKQPWLTQRWSRAVLDRYYGVGVANAYLGDEDQGQMSGWFIMAALGLFQMDGGCRVNPIYEIASPLYPKVVIDLGKRYGRGQRFVIEARGTSRRNQYVQKATLNGQPLSTFWFPAEKLLQGGRLVLEMGDTPNTAWGVLPDKNLSGASP
jgi:predicted alpha-1,2-mannosidase